MTQRVNALNIAKILLIALTYQTMLNVTRPLVSLYGSEMGASTAEIGLLTATYAFFPLLLAIKAGKISDRFGDRLPVIFGVIGLTIGTGVPFFFKEMWALYLSQGMIGLGQIFINVSLQNLIGTLSPKELLDQRFSMFSLSVSLGGLIGPLLGGHIADEYGFAYAYLLAFIIGVIPTGIAFLLPVLKREHGQEQDQLQRSSSFDLLKLPDFRKALAISALVLYSRDIFVAYFPLYASQKGYTTAAISLVITVLGLASVFVRTFLAFITKKWGRNRVLFLSLIIAGIAFVLVPLFKGIYLYCILAALIGLGLGCGQPLSMTTAFLSSPEARKGEALGLRLGSNRLFQVISPVFFGLFGTIAGLGAVFYLSGSFLILGSYITRSDKDQMMNNESRSS